MLDPSELGDRERELTLEELYEACTIADVFNPGDRLWIGDVMVEDGVVYVLDDEAWSVAPHDPRYKNCLLAGLVRQMHDRSV